MRLSKFSTELHAFASKIYLLTNIKRKFKLSLFSPESLPNSMSLPPSPCFSFAVLSSISKTLNQKFFTTGQNLLEKVFELTEQIPKYPKYCGEWFYLLPHVCHLWMTSNKELQGLFFCRILEDINISFTYQP